MNKPDETSQIYNYTNTLAAHGKQSMAKRNITLSKDGGMRVGYKEMGAEEYSDKTQSWLVRAYNLSTWPAYKSRLWNKETASNSHDTAKAVTDGNAVSRRNTAAR